MTTFRTVGEGAALSYRALFTWLNPLGYLSTRVVRPIGLAVAFTALSDYYGEGAGRVMVGASILAGAGAVLFGMALAVGNERSFGTLELWLASPQNKLLATCQRALPHLLDGIVGGALTYSMCCLLYWSTPVPVPTFLAVLVIGTVAASGMGLVLSALALLVKDLFLGPNAAELLLMVLSGTLISTAHWPAAARMLAQVVPLSHVMSVVGSPVPTVRWTASAIAGEAIVTVAWAALGAVLLHRATRSAVRRPPS